MSESPWQPIRPTSWPQDELQVPRAGRGQMPHIERANYERVGREFAQYSTTFNFAGAITAGQEFNLFIQTEMDGDFWCDQIFATGWNTSIAPASQNKPLVGPTIDISDARTGKYLTYPRRSVPLLFFGSLVLFSDDAGYDNSSNPLPDGFRSTATIPQPFCFTRQGGINITLGYPDAVNAGNRLIDIAFSGWKEYRHASG